ncbi:exodeoxyribonuclease VII large subunit [Sporomusaceae bacterium BoRhaA]|uniref:exodeoxyribonuclease VII large subunit n=1 Tax=Pelorhabdus rhamnosifermentans TaxID=2772457 RepID=UPI001C05F04F|nr:exodeoxyribonuclease VII large subunit [Pelorhabdus rhamnosifermentans]MBU2700943.1 exodeoxyribonuclease VII large subunit [Pelorhabdus rhamnosifermentans]
MGILSVAEATRYIKQLFDQDLILSALLVRGEISNFKHPASGHCYFTLKDAQATIRSVMFRSKAQYLKFMPRDGMKVIVRGRIQVFERDGQYQLYADQIVPEGVGELSLAYEQLKEKLSQEGLFDESRKKRLPLLPKAVGIITSSTGAALRDIVTVSKRRYKGIPLVLYPVAVQGIESAPQLVQAIRDFNHYGKVDVLIMGRGGGSLEELWSFNDERVIRAMSESILPIVSAVGHQTDFTLADFASDVRAATPSQAAEIVVPDVNELLRHIRSLEDRLKVQMFNQLRVLRLRVEACQKARIMREPQELFVRQQQILDDYQEKLVQVIKQKIADNRQRQLLLSEKLAMLSPLAVLGRGYSIVRRKDGQVITRANQVAPGDELTLLLAEGNLTVQVIQRGKEPYHEK